MKEANAKIDTGMEIRNHLNDEMILQELYSLSATIDGLRGFYQPEYRQREFRKMVITDIQVKIDELISKIKYRIDKSEQMMLEHNN